MCAALLALPKEMANICLSLFSTEGAPRSVVGDILPLGKTGRTDKTASQNSHRSAAGSLENLAHHCDSFHIIRLVTKR